MAFVHLHVHSNYSLLAGASPIDDLVGGAAGMGMGALALTDTNGLYGVVPFVEACKKAGLKPIPGVEIACPPSAVPKGSGTSPQVNGTAVVEKAVLLPRNRDGYKEISRIATARHLDKTFSLQQTLQDTTENVFILCGCRSLLEHLDGRKNVYIELPNAADSPGRQQRYFFKSLAENLRLRCVATNDVHFLAPDGHFTHKVLSAIRTGTTVGTLPDGAVVTPDGYLKREAEMQTVFRDFPDSLRAAAEIAWACDVDLGLGKLRPPPFDVPAGESDYSYLATLAFEGLRHRLGAFTREAHETLTRELDVIERLGMASYFLVCWDIMRFARENGMPCLGRGSAANSMVSYCLWITHVNPLEHNLFFERFLNLERGTPPDFDLDFGTEDREEVLDYIFEKYGYERTAMVSTVNTLRARSAVREVTKALGIPEGEVDSVIKRIPHYSSAADLKDRLQSSADTRTLPITDEPFRTIFEVARRISNFPRHLATHPCGVVISPEPITDLIPLEMGEKGLEITQWSMYPVEDVGLIKIDVLGQKGLAVIKETVQSVQTNYQREIRPESIDYLKDEKGRALMRRGKTQGCFYIESPIMQQLLCQANCDDFEVLTALSSIIRPGVSNYGGKQQYLKRYLGEEPVRFLHPCLEDVLRDTFGCLIYQEQVILVAVSMAGMTLAEADGLRLCMSKKRNWERMDNYKERFFRGAREKGIPDPVIEEVFSQIESFAGYAFCKAHSASFALESFESLYWRAHYPAEFMAAVLSNQGGYYTTMEYIEEARRMGLRILHPCISRSNVRYTGKGRELRVGLMQVKGLREGIMEQIVAEREREGGYRSVEDFVRRVPVTRREAETLAKCGAMDTLGGRRPELLWQVALCHGTGQRKAAIDGEPVQDGSGNGGGDGRRPSDGKGAEAVVMPAARRDVKALVGELPVLDDFSFTERLELELECLDICVSAHPFALFKKQLDRVRRLRPIVDSNDIAHHAGKRIYCLGWEVCFKRVTTENDGRAMVFVSFSDEWGRIETTIFPDVYEKCADELYKGLGPFLLLGRVELNMGVPNLVVDRIALIR
jgi:error-prone DNA polymerase